MDDAALEDRLNRYWDALVRGAAANPDGLDPALATTVRRFQSLARTVEVEAAFARVWQGVVGTPVPPASPNGRVALGPPMHGRQGPRWRRFAELAAVVILLLAIVGGFFGADRLFPDRPAVAPSQATPTSPAPPSPTASPLAPSPTQVSAPLVGATPSSQAAPSSPTASPGAFTPTHVSSRRYRVNFWSEPNVQSSYIMTVLDPATPLQFLGQEATADGRTWLKVRTEDGKIGWIGAIDAEPVDEGSPATPGVDVWASLERPLQLPTLEPGSPCPRAEGKRVSPHFGFGVGEGPVYATLGPDAVVNLGQLTERDGWFMEKVIWFVGPEYDGPILVRGHQIDGPNEVRFGSSGPMAELWLAGGGGIAVNAPGWRFWTHYIRVPGPGCYAYQVDGVDFSYVTVFQAVEQSPDELTPLPSWQGDTPPLPRSLNVDSAVETAPGRVRLALGGARQLVIRIDVEPATTALLDLPGADVQRSETAAGPVLWQPDPTDGWPRVAVWDDGERRYRLEVLDGAWAERDLIKLVEAFATAGEDGQAS